VVGNAGAVTGMRGGGQSLGNHTGNKSESQILNELMGKDAKHAQKNGNGNGNGLKEETPEARANRVKDESFKVICRGYFAKNPKTQELVDFQRDYLSPFWGKLIEGMKGVLGNDAFMFCEPSACAMDCTGHKEVGRLYLTGLYSLRLTEDSVLINRKSRSIYY
jgi:hypothetical protein